LVVLDVCGKTQANCTARNFNNNFKTYTKLLSGISRAAAVANKGNKKLTLTLLTWRIW
jgi:hypothetical protein